MSMDYEIVIFTSGTEDYANLILNDLETKDYISHRLFRQHCSIDGEMQYKDLLKLGRDLSKTIIVDNSPSNYKYFNDNGIYVKTWYREPHDKQLVGLAKLLKQIVLNNIDDVRKVIKNINTQIDKKKIHTSHNPYDEIDLSRIKI
jgi:RNA polymerase II subunit A small phosphatase-like protein